MPQRMVIAALCALLGCGAPAQRSTPAPATASAVGAEPVARDPDSDVPAPAAALDGAALARALETALARPLAGHVTLDLAARIGPSRDVEPTEGVGWRAWLDGARRGGRVVEVIEDGGDAVRVRTLARQPCADQLDGAFYILEGWAPRSALLPVNEGDAVQLHPDGSGMLIRAGHVPSLREGTLEVARGRLAVAIGVEQLGFAVPADHRMGSLAEGLGGSWYDLASHEPGTRQFSAEEFEARVGGSVMLSRTCLERGYCRDRGPLAFTHFPRAFGREQDGARHLVLGDRCFEVAAVVDALTSFRAGGLGSLGGPRPGAEPCYSVPAGAALEWEDGTRAGHVRTSITVAASTRPRAEPRTCSRRLIDVAAAPVCVRAEDLRETSCTRPLAW